MFIWLLSLVLESFLLCCDSLEKCFTTALMVQIFLRKNHRHLSEPGKLSPGNTLFGCHSLCGWYRVTYPLLPVLVYIIPGLCVTTENYTLWMTFLHHVFEKHPGWTVL